MQSKTVSSVRMEQGTSALSATVVGGQSFQPVHQSMLSTFDDSGNTFVTHVELPGGTLRGAVSPPPLSSQYSHIRPMSPFEKAGIMLQRSTTPSLSSAIARGPLTNTGVSPQRQALSRPSSSMSCSLPVLSQAEDDRYDPSLSWFESHYFYTKDKSASKGISGTGKRGSSVTSGSFALSGDESGGFFQSVLGTRKIATYTGDFAPQMTEVRQAYDNKSTPANLTSFVGNLIFKVDERGWITFGNVGAFLIDLVPATEWDTCIEQCRAFLCEVGGASVSQQQGPSSPNGSTASAAAVAALQASRKTTGLPPALTSAPWYSWTLPFHLVYNAVDSMFNGRLVPLITRRCFDLCDVTKCGYILKDVLKQFRDEERMAALAAAPPPGVVLPPPGLTFLVVKGTWRVFERIAVAEEEKARNTGGKGKKGKSKKGATGPVTVPGKRQFHINFSEFSDAMRVDPFMVLSFLPYSIEVCLKERLLC